MGYPGNPELSTQAQERVLSAFRQVVAKLQDGQRENALIGLEFVLRLDPTFAPAQNLQRQLASGASEIDLSEIVAQLESPTTEAINTFLVEAVEAFNSRDYDTAKQYVDRVLSEQPGHAEGRQLLTQIQDALKVETQVGYFLEQARQALASGDQQEAANFVLMAQALDPHHQDIATALEEVNASAGAAPQQPAAQQDPDPVSFQAFDDSQGAPDQGFGFEPAQDAGFQSPAETPGAPPTTQDPNGFAGPGSDFDPGGFGSSPQGASPWDQPSDNGASGGMWDQSAADQAPAGGGFEYGSPADSEGSFAGSGFQTARTDVTDLFASDPSAAPQASPEHPRSHGDDIGDREEAVISGLVGAGKAALATEDYREAIQQLSRVFLIDPHHHVAGQLLEQARHAQEELDQQVEQLLFDAQDAAMGGETQRTLDLVAEVEKLDPTSIEAHDLRLRIQGEGDQPTSAASGLATAPDMPDLDDDLFSEDITVDEPVLAGGSIHDRPLPSASEPAAKESPLARIPWRTVGLAGAGVVVLVAAVLAGMALLGGDSGEGGGDRTVLVTELLQQADGLMKQGRGDEALHLLQSFEAVDEIEEQRIGRRIAAYQEQLTPPTPTPIPEMATRAEQLVDSGRWFAAYLAIDEGLQAHPDDPGLLKLREDVNEIQPEVGSLFAAMRSKNYRTAVGIARDLLAQHPSQTEINEILDRCLFNAALAELKTYNLAGAETFLRQLRDRRPEDAEVERILSFTASYKTRPVDMQLEIFVGSLKPR